MEELSTEAGSVPCYVIDIKKDEDLSPLLGLIQEQALTETQVILREQAYVPRLVSQEDYTKRHHRLLAPEPSMYLDSRSGNRYLILGAAPF